MFLFNILLNRERTPQENILLFVLIAGALVMSLTLHEMAHAYAALWSGDRTAKVNGRLSPNPLRHLDPIGTVMLLTVGFGFAKPVPVNPNNFKNKKKGLFLVSIAGVTVNLILGLIASFVYVLLLRFGNGSFAFFAGEFFYALLFFNLMLLFFNLIPIFPLDGFRLIESQAPRSRFVAFMRKNGVYIFIGLIVLSVLVGRTMQFENTPWWFEFFDILGTYLRFTAQLLTNSLIRLWSLIFGV